MPAATAKKERTVQATVRHLEGCPSQRLEEYDAEAPSGATHRVVRCVDCGEAKVTTHEIEEG